MKWLLPAVFCLLAETLTAQSLVLDIKGIRTCEGHIQIMIYKNAEQYDQDAPDCIKRFSKTGMTAGCVKIGLELPPGQYGIILMDDDIDSEVMEFNLLGIPKKGFGFAGYAQRGIRRPKFEDFAFEIKDRVVMKEIVVKYF